MKRIKIMTSLLFLCISNIILGCSCDSIIPFSKNIDEETSIVHVKILKHGLLPVEYVKKIKFDHIFKSYNFENDSISSPPLPPFDYFSYTVLKFANRITPSPISDTIVFFNGTGSMCLGSINHLKQGGNYIIKIKNKQKFQFEDEIRTRLESIGLKNEDWWDRDIYTNDICYEWLLKLENGLVSGNITQNKLMELLKELNRTNNALTEDEKRKKQQIIRETKPEEMLFSDFVHLINNNLKKT
ncbi:MAG: hypothetical protein R2771_05305 [Saprospiraceae bacterium]